MGLQNKEECTWKMCVTNTGFSGFTALFKNIKVFWNVTPCQMEISYICFRGACCHHQGTFQKNSSPCVIKFKGHISSHALKGNK